MKKMIIANWKMKLGLAESIALGKEYARVLTPETVGDKTVVACPNHVALAALQPVFNGSPVRLGAQNVFWEEAGAYTGEVAPGTLAEAGCTHVIIGHSERRQHLLENYQMIHQKTKAVLADTDMVPVVCIGETLAEREHDKQDYVLADQLQQALGGMRLLDSQQLIIAYEPIWAIGSGKVITPEDAITMHEIIHAVLVDLFGIDAVKNNIAVVYGGSVTRDNAKKFAALDNVDGLLIGGASLDAAEFADIVTAL